MTPDALDIFGEAMEIADAKERATFLIKACGSDAALRQKVEQLLATHEELGETHGFLGGGLAEEPTGQVGRYQLLQKIGEGGGGIVYLAGQTEPVRRRVALKIIKPGMDTRQVIVV